MPYINFIVNFYFWEFYKKFIKKDKAIYKHSFCLIFDKLVKFLTICLNFVKYGENKKKTRKIYR